MLTLIISLFLGLSLALIRYRLIRLRMQLVNLHCLYSILIDIPICRVKTKCTALPTALLDWISSNSNHHAAAVDPARSSGRLKQYYASSSSFTTINTHSGMLTATRRLGQTGLQNLTSQAHRFCSVRDGRDKLAKFFLASQVMLIIEHGTWPGLLVDACSWTGLSRTPSSACILQLSNTKGTSIQILKTFAENLGLQALVGVIAFYACYFLLCNGSRERRRGRIV